MQTKDLMQGSQAWLRARLGKLTGSKFHIIMTGTTKARSDQGLLSVGAETHILTLLNEVFTDEPTPQAKCKAIEWGNEYEPEARKAYVERMLIKDPFFTVFESGLILHPENDMVGASLDGMFGEDGTIEIKCPHTGANHFKYRTDVTYILKEHKAQIQGGRWVTGRKYCDFISYDPRVKNNKLKLFIKRFQRDETYIAELQEKAFAFVDRMKAVQSVILETA